MTEDDFEQWKALPMTIRIRDALFDMIEIQKEDMADAYLAGNPVNEAVRIRVMAREEFLGDIFGASFEDLERLEEMLDE